jgi:large subunit ribosomal protein L9
MKVLLLSDIYKQGVAGEVVEVSDGYARNYLIPKKLAAKATPNELKKAEKLRETASARKAELEGRLNDLARQIDGVELIFGRRAANTGKLFGSVTTSDIAELLHKQTGIDINRRRISQQALREIGTFDIPVRLGSEISPVLKVSVVREEEMQSFLAKRKAAAEAGTDEAPTVVETVVETAKDAVEAVAEVAGSVVKAVAGAVESAVETVTDALKPDDNNPSESE